MVYGHKDLTEMRRAGIDVTDFIGEDTDFTCPICGCTLDLLGIVGHVLLIHAETGLASEVRRILAEEAGGAS